MVPDVGVGVVGRPGGHRVHLDEAAAVDFDDWCRGAGSAVIAPQSGEPGHLPGQGAVQEVDLACLAAGFLAVGPDVRGIRVGSLHPQVQRIAGLCTSQYVECLGEVEPGVEEHDLDLRVDRYGEVDEQGVLEGCGEAEGVAEHGDRPADDLDRVR